jgi:molybdopterin-binding protein
VADNGYVRVEIGLDGGQILSTLVTGASADELEKSLNGGAAGALALEA